MLISLKEIRSSAQLKFFATLIAFSFLGNLFTQVSVIWDCDFKIELSEKPCEDKSENSEKDLEKETEKDHFYTEGSSLAFGLNENKKTDPFSSIKSLFVRDIISPPPEHLS